MQKNQLNNALETILNHIKDLDNNEIEISIGGEYGNIIYYKNLRLKFDENNFFVRLNLIKSLINAEVYFD